MNYGKVVDLAVIDVMPQPLAAASKAAFTVRLDRAFSYEHSAIGSVRATRKPSRQLTPNGPRHPPRTVELEASFVCPAMTRSGIPESSQVDIQGIAAGVQGVDLLGPREEPRAVCGWN